MCGDNGWSEGSFFFYSRRASFFLLVYRFFFQQGTWTWPIIITLYAAVRRTSMYLYILVLYFCCCSVLLSCCCCSCSAAACCWLFIIVCWMTQFVAVVYCVWFQFLFIQTRFIFNIPLGSAVACTASIYVYSCNTQYRTSSKITGMRGAIHSRKIKACAEPRRTASHGGEALLVNICIDVFALSSQRSRS